jgi:predicted DNA-binding transcriptional regulator AlpA
MIYDIVPPVGSAEDRLLNVKQVATRLNVSTRQVWRLVAKNELSPPVKIGRSARWFSSDIQAYGSCLRKQRSRTRVEVSKND